MRFIPLSLPGAFKVELSPIRDERGYFVRRFCANEFSDHGLEVDFVQRSTSFNAHRGTLRGLHFQSPVPETRIVRCTSGAVFDVIVDLRRSSPTFGKWHSEQLNSTDHALLYVPTGVAHGYQTLADRTELDYEITTPYVPSLSRGVRFNDPSLAIPWPTQVTIISPKDLALPFLDDAELPS